MDELALAKSTSASRLRFRMIWVVAFACLGLVRFGYSQEFYRDKTITIISGRAPGGTGDMRVRAVVPFLRKHIPGQPAVTIQTMPGAGGRLAANHIYKVARADGLTLANIGSGFVTAAVLGEAGVQYDLMKFTYLGTPKTGNVGSAQVFLTRKDLGLDTAAKLRAASGLRVGAHSVGHEIYTIGRLFAYFLDLKEPRFVVGYSGPEINIALMAGELDARGISLSGIEQQNPDWLTKGLVDFHGLIEVPKGSHPSPLSLVPDLDVFARLERERKVLALYRAFELLGSPYILPSGVPEDRVRILRDAFRNTYADAEFIKSYKKMVGEDVTPLAPEDQEKLIKEIPREREVIELFKKITGPEPLPQR
jgi:tripartite-type tricarboxylate transporter receptor subunit TctC